VRLAQAPTSTVYIAVTAEPDIRLNREGTPQGDSILLATTPLGSVPNPGDHRRQRLLPARAHGRAHDRPAAAGAGAGLHTGNWRIPQLVWAGAMNDALDDGLRTYEIGHSVLSADPFYANAAVRRGREGRSGYPAILVTNLSNTNPTGISIASPSPTASAATATFHLGHRELHPQRRQAADRLDRQQRRDPGEHRDPLRRRRARSSCPPRSRTRAASTSPCRAGSPPSSSTATGRPRRVEHPVLGERGLQRGDVGRGIVEADTGSAIPAGATIVAVAADGTWAQLSVAAVATVTAWSSPFRTATRAT
jgi:hypothetical protein